MKGTAHPKSHKCEASNSWKILILMSLHYRFASSLRDRFHTAGISGSMQQHKVQTQKKNVAREIHKANIERELQDDEKRLQELENKLREVRLPVSLDDEKAHTRGFLQIREQKQLRQQRKLLRKRARLENRAAACIQRAWLRYRSVQSAAAAMIIKSFLRFGCSRVTLNKMHD
jgi:hypothetical protein